MYSTDKILIMIKKIKLSIAFLALAINMQAQNLFWFIENNKVGFKDINGTSVIKPQFAMAGNFINGITYAGKGENAVGAKYGFIDSKGKWIIQPDFDAADDFAEAKARVLKNNKWGYINTAGKMIIEPRFRLCYSFLNGYAKATTDNKNWGLIDSKGNFVIEPVYYDITDIGKEGVLAVKETVSSKWKLINLKKELVSNKEFGLVRNFSQGLAAARDENDKWGFINSKGEWVIEPKYTNAASFSEGLAAVETDYSNWGFIDKSNAVLIKPIYDRQAVFLNGFAKVEKGNEYMYIDKTGKVVLSFAK